MKLRECLLECTKLQEVKRMSVGVQSFSFVLF